MPSMESTLVLTESPLYQRLEALTVDVLDLRDAALAPGTHFADDLGADSLDLVELVEALEQEFGVRIDDQELADIATVGEAYSLLESKLS
jgi:acyl carrier protein